MGAKLSSPKTKQVTNSSLKKLAWAVAMHETHNCEDKTNFTAGNNCHGIKKYRNGRLMPARYASIEESHKDFVDIWSRLYGGRTVPTKADAVKWSGNDKADEWHANVLYFLLNPITK